MRIESPIENCICNWGTYINHARKNRFHVKRAFNISCTIHNKSRIMK